MVDLRSMVVDMRAMMELMVQQQTMQGASVLAIEPAPPDFDMQDDPNFQVVSPPRSSKKSSLATGSTTVAHSPPPLQSQAVRNAKRGKVATTQPAPDYNPYSSLGRAAFGESEDETDAESESKETIESMEIDEAEEKIKKLSIQQSKPGAVNKQNGTGRRE